MAAAARAHALLPRPSPAPQAQTVAELAAAKSKLVTTESRLAKLQDRHTALQQQYQSAQKTAAEWEAAGVKRLVRGGPAWAAGRGLCACRASWTECMWALGAARAPRDQSPPSSCSIPTLPRSAPFALLHTLLNPPSPPLPPHPPHPQEDTEELLAETQAKLKAAEAQVGPLPALCLRKRKELRPRYLGVRAQTLCPPGPHRLQPAHQIPLASSSSTPDPAGR